MIRAERDQFNSNFTLRKYNDFLKALEEGYHNITFRVAETPVFIPEDLKKMLISAGSEIISLIQKQNFKLLTERSIPREWKVPNENDHPHFLTFDFGICQDTNGTLKPMLIEMQGFPSLYGFQSHLATSYIEKFELNPALSPYFNGLDKNSYISLLKKVIVGKHLPKEVALMDVDAINQKTAIDFFVTQNYLGIKILSLDQIFKEGKHLFYEENGEKIRLKRIYNRLIFDEIGNAKTAFVNSFDPRDELDIEWVTHPNWFYRISKFTMPFLKSEFVPDTFFVNELKSIPIDLENYVLKPLFSFAGQGVIIDVTESDLQNLKNPEDWILQKKVVYAPAVQALDGGVKVEIRLMYLWPEDEEPQLCINLARLSRGKMIGVRYNQDFDWVGGTVGLFV